MIRNGKPGLFRLAGALAAFAAAVTGAMPASAQQAGGDKNAAIYMYRGADRDQRLVEKAKQEGTVVWYTSMATKESMPLAKAFEEKYGIKVELWRATSDKVVQRAVSEARGNRFAFDVVETNGPEVEMLARERLLAEFHSPHFADLPPAAFPAHRLWVSDRTNFFVVAFNTNKVKREEIPDSYQGFLDPKWKGKIAVEATDYEWMATLVKKWGQERGMDFFRKLSQMRPDVRKSHILMAEMVGAGEIPVALSIYNSQVESLKMRGGPIDWKPVEPVVGRPQALGLAKLAPHPHAALLFADFILSPQGQQMLNEMGRIPTSTKVKSNLNNFPYTMIDPATALDEMEKWEKTWNELFVTR